MRELGVDVSCVLPWFRHEQDSPYVIIRIPADQVECWVNALSIPLRRCYLADELLESNAQRTGYSRADIVTAKLPDRGSTMAGDFGEILVYLMHAAEQHPKNVVGPKKWRLKQDRTKPAPYSDVVHFVVPSWPTPTEDDLLLCSEVKTKSTNGDSSPIKDALEDSKKDQLSRLTRTLMWLRERALGEDLGTTTVAHLNRFIDAPSYPPAQKHFYAVAVLCASLIASELSEAPIDIPDGHKLVVISVPQLKQCYEAVFDAALDAVVEARGTT